MMMPNDPKYQARATLEDLQALVVAAEDHLSVIFTVAWNEPPGGYEIICHEVAACRKLLREVWRIQADGWCQVQQVIESASDERTR